MDPIAVLTGRWAIERRLLDVASGVEGAFRGVASFEPAGDGLVWIEHGRLRFGGYDGAAGRRLRIVPAWTVTFEDGSPFHALALPVSDAEHRCGDDVYRGRYRLLAPDALDVVWHVTGPHKQQRIDTAYRRC